MGDVQGVIRHNWQPERFAQVPNGILYEKWANGLSFRAIGLYATLAGFQPGRRVTVSYLQTLASDRRDAILAAVAELKAVGVLEIDQVRKDGKVVGSAWTIYESPQSEKPGSEKPTVEKAHRRGVRPGSELPTVANPEQLRLRTQLKQEISQDGAQLEREFLTAWNSLVVPYLPGVSACRTLNSGQRRDLIQRNSEQSWRDSWLEALNRVRSSAFLCGAVPSEQCPQGYIMTIGLALSEKFVPNMQQGVYHRHGTIELGSPKQGEKVL